MGIQWNLLTGYFFALRLKSSGQRREEEQRLGCANCTLIERREKRILSDKRIIFQTVLVGQARC
jgi:hypothetical protein